MLLIHVHGAAALSESKKEVMKPHASLIQGNPFHVGDGERA